MKIIEQLPGKWLLCIDCIDWSVPFPANELDRDILLGIVGATEETWLTSLDGTTDGGGDTGALSTWFCCAAAATAYPDTGGGGVVGGGVFSRGSSPLLDS